VEYGTCKLCLKEKPICLSHLIPEAKYKYCWHEGQPPVLITPKEVGPSEEQLVAYLLCSDCENQLNRDGENWLLPKLARRDGPFPFYDILATGEPDLRYDDFVAYACAKNPKIGFRKLTNFAMGVSWKSSIHPWHEGRLRPQIDLGPYCEAFRKFLNHEARFPENTRLMIVVSPPDKAIIGFNVPAEKQKQPYRQYIFHIPGMVFILGVGRGMEPGWEKMCFYTSQLHPVLVSDISDALLRSLSKSTRKAMKVAHASRVLPRRQR
jgi:hypothetical protein